MINKVYLKFFGWIDDLFEKVEEVWTFDIGQENHKKRKGSD